MPPDRELEIPFAGGPLPGLVRQPAAARWLYVFAHGAGAGMRHAFMAAMADALAAHGIATLRYELPFMARRSRRPDPPAVCEAAVRAACAVGMAIGLPMLAGGKSMGGRMTSQAQAHAPLEGVRGLVFLGFPLHLAKKPATTRAVHLAGVRVPMLFVQGPRDALAEPALLAPVLAALPTATYAEIDGADHGFAVPARRRGDDIPDEIAGHVARWIAAAIPD